MDEVDPPGRWGSFRPSLVAALGILAYMLVTTIVVTAASQLTYLSRLSPEYFLVDFARTAATFGGFAGACLLSFWLVAPIVGRLSFWQVIVRVVIAAGIGFVVLIPIQFALLSLMYSAVEPTQGGGLTDLVNLTSQPSNLVALAIGNSLQIAVSRLPEIALAALALWWWLRRSTTAEGALDEV